MGILTGISSSLPGRMTITESSVTSGGSQVPSIEADMHIEAPVGLHWQVGG